MLCPLMLYLTIIQRRAEARAIMDDLSSPPSRVATACAFLIQWGP
jgi:hypothetical protein